jgi:hypothetical protein
LNVGIGASSALSVRWNRTLSTPHRERLFVWNNRGGRQEDIMPLWKLSPADPQDPCWEIWSAKPVYVNADNEVAARTLAVSERLLFAPSVGHAPRTMSPWSEHQQKDHPPKATCERVT